MKERIQHELGIIAHPELWYAEDWLELRASRSRWHTCCTPQNNKEENTSRRQYKEQVLSRYHRSTQNRKQYILNNNIKSITILNRWQQQVQEPLATTPSTPMRTQASTRYSFGKRFFIFEYIKIIQDSFSLFLLCRNVALRSPNTTFRFVTPDPLILRVGS